jgi:hypothetical protein
MVYLPIRKILRDNRGGIAAFLSDKSPHYISPFQAFLKNFAINLRVLGCSVNFY